MGSTNNKIALNSSVPGTSLNGTKRLISQCVNQKPTLPHLSEQLEIHLASHKESRVCASHTTLKLAQNCKGVGQIQP